MKIGKFIKAPGERIRYVVDYNEWLDLGETVAAATFEVIPIEDLGQLVVDDSQIGDDQRSVVIFVSGGNAGVEYWVTAIMTSLGGQIKQDQILFVVKD